MTTVYDVIDDLRAHYRSSSELGGAFERLIQQYLRTIRSTRSALQTCGCGRSGLAGREDPIPGARLRGYLRCGAPACRVAPRL